MLGIYEDFPDTIHCAASFAYKTSKVSLQKAVLNTFYTINKEKYPLNDIATTPTIACTVSFECGIAEALTFNYMDDEELGKFKKILAKKNSFETLDFLCIARYHAEGTGTKQKPLKFDHYMLRFNFHEKTMLILAYHEKGPQHILPEDFLKFTTRNIVKELRK